MSFLCTIVKNLLRRGGYLSIRQGLRKLTYDIKGMLALGGVTTVNAPTRSRLRQPWALFFDVHKDSNLLRGLQDLLIRQTNQ